MRFLPLLLPLMPVSLLYGEGEVIWSSYIGGPDMEIPYDVEVDYFSNAYVVVGITNSYDLDSGDVWVVKVDASDGSVLWQSSFGGHAWDAALGVTVDRNGYYVVTGYTRKPGVSPYDFDMWVGKLDPVSGDTLWTSIIDYGNYDFAYDVVEAPDGNYMVVGRVSTDFAILRVDASTGQILEMNTYGPTADGYYGSYLPRIISEKDGNMVITGSMYNSSTRTDVVVFSVDSSGNLLWRWSFDGGDAMDDYPGGIASIGDGRYAVGGSAHLLDTTGYFSYHGWVFIMDTAGNVLDSWIYDKFSPTATYVNGLMFDPEGYIAGVGQKLLAHWLFRLNVGLDSVPVLDTIYDMGNLNWAVEGVVDTGGYYVVAGYGNNDFTLLKVRGWNPVSSRESPNRPFRLDFEGSRWVVHLQEKGDVSLFSPSGRLIFRASDVFGEVRLPAWKGCAIIRITTGRSSLSLPLIMQ